MGAFRGSFKEHGRQLPDGRIDLGHAIVMPAPNRYRKMIRKDASITSSWGDGDYDNAAVIERQASEFPYPNPVGIEFDLFDVYLAWEPV